MELKDFISLLGRKKQTIFSIMLLFLLVASVFTFIQPFKYRATSRVLLLQYNGVNADPYAESKSSEYVSNLLAQVVTSNAFLNDVFDSGYNVDKAYFGENPTNKLKIWNKTAEAKAINDSGIIEIKTYHTDKSQTEQINSAIINIIKTKNNLYYGRQPGIDIKVIDEPIVSKYPVRPNVVMNVTLSIIVALLVSFSFIYLYPEEEYNLNIFPKRKMKQAQVITEENKIDFNKKITDYVPEKKVEHTPESSNYTQQGDMRNIFNK